jgi:hypothetical protein
MSFLEPNLCSEWPVLIGQIFGLPFWLELNNYLNNYILGLKQCAGWKDQGLTVFIDTNPALTMYTRLALCAARKLVMVVMADDFSREALRYVSQFGEST